MQIHVREHGRALGVVEAHVVIIHLPAHRRQGSGVRRVGNVGLHAHQLQKALEAGRAVGEYLHEVDQCADGGDERRHIQRERDEVDVVDLTAHDVRAAERDDHDLHGRHRKLHPALKHAHGAVPVGLAVLVAVVAGEKLLALDGLVRECLGCAHAGDAGLDDGVDLGLPALDGDVCVVHALALADRDPQRQRHEQQQHERELPADRRQDRERAAERDHRREQILRPVVRQLRNGKEVARHAAHEHARAVAVKEAEAHRLQMLKELLTHIRFDEHAALVADDGHGVFEHGLEQICCQKRRHDGEECAEQSQRQQVLHRLPRDIGKRQIRQT